MSAPLLLEICVGAARTVSLYLVRRDDDEPDRVSGILIFSDRAGYRVTAAAAFTNVIVRSEGDSPLYDREWSEFSQVA